MKPGSVQQTIIRERSKVSGTFIADNDSVERNSGNVRSLRVAHVVEAGQGGIETAVRLLIEAQANDSMVGSIHLLADSDRLGDLLRHSPARLHLYKSSRRLTSLLKASRELYRKLVELDPDVVYLHSTFPGVYGRILHRRKSATWKTIYCPHGWAFTQKASRLKRHAYLSVERLLSSRADAIVSISNNEFAAAAKGGLQHDAHEVILHGVPHPVVSEERKFPSSDDQINLLFVGRYDRQKGLDSLLKAWMDTRLAHVHLWILGDATLPDATKVLEQQNIHPLGWIPNSQIDSYIQSCDAVIVPSRWEGFGLVALEAMRNGKAVIASRVGGLQELVIDGANGYFVNPEDTESFIKTLQAIDKKKLGELGSTAKKVFETAFSWDVCYERWQSLMVRLSEAAQRSRSAMIPPLGNMAKVSHRTIKRSLDILVAASAIFFLSPLLLCVAVIVKMTSDGPVLYGNERIGQHGRRFRAWKFRSMLPDSDHVLKEYLEKNQESRLHFARFHKLPDDPRITKFGKFIRKTSLDELPQLLNILFGDMSLVGPRPIVLEEVPRYIGAYELYMSVKPGLTGLWQVSGRNHTTFAERVAFDEYYVRNWSVWLDLHIIARTARVVLFAEGAY